VEKGSSSSASAVDIALALVWRDGCVLITRRPEGVHLGGMWEFPGGKCFPGETPEACAEREALEEVGVACRARDRYPVIEHPYPDRCVRLHPVACDYVGGPPRALQVAEWAWARPEDLHRYLFPPANERLLRSLHEGRGERGEGRG
jgi:mutator protein MutT